MARPLKLENPVFLLASERSGSNLVRVICGSHPSVAAPPPPHLLMNFLPELPTYGDLAEDESFMRLCRDVVTVLRHQLGRWRTSPSPEELFEEVEARSFMAVFDHVYDREREAAGARRVFFKENETFDFVPTLRSRYPDARFVYLIRDGRDVLASWLRSPTHFGTVPRVAELWCLQQRQCIRTFRDLKDEGVIHPLYYEDLVTRPEPVLRELCSFLEEDYVPELLDFHRRSSVVQEAGSIQNWEHLSRPVIEQHVRLYRKRLSRRKVRRFETLAFRELRLLGFELEYPVDRLIRARRLRGMGEKGLLFLSKALRGRLMSWPEAKRRRRRVEALNRMGTERDRQIEPILRPRFQTDA